MTHLKVIDYILMLCLNKSLYDYCLHMLATFRFHSKPPNLYRWPTYWKHVKLWKLVCSLSDVQVHSSECRDRWWRRKAGTVLNHVSE